MEKYEIEEDGDFKIPADLKYKFICEHIIGKNLDYDNLTCADIDNFVEGIEPIKFLGFISVNVDDHVKNEKVFLHIYTSMFTCLY